MLWPRFPGAQRQEYQGRAINQYNILRQII